MYLLHILFSKEAKSFNNRSDDEKKEGHETVNTGSDPARFQDSKQIVKPDDMGVTKSSIPGSDKGVTTSNITADAAKSLHSKIKIRPDVSVDELKNTQVGGVPLAETTGVLRSVAGVSTQSLVEDRSKIPYSRGNYRPDSRYGKKRSEDLFEMDHTISEQIVPVVDDAKDLAEAPDAKQGYNGRKQFKQTRSKKNFTYNVSFDGTVYSDKLPQQLLNEASVDLKERDKVIHTTGQVLDVPESRADYPIVRWNAGDDETPNWRTVRPMHKGNYKPTALRFTITDGHITSVRIDEDRIISPTTVTDKDQANMNWQIDANNVAKTVIKLQTELGRETTNEWSPLGYVIDQPYEFNMLMHDIEATTGAIQAAAYRSAVSSLAYQRNILGKDGVNPQTTAIKMILEGYAGNLSSSERNHLRNIPFNISIFNRSAYKEGSVAALIDMFDTTSKYRTKADFLGLQRSLPLHLSQADNNLNPLHCKPNFIKILDKAHTFSTTDGNYNPMLPIYTSKRIKLVNPLSLNLFLLNWKNPALFSNEDYNDPRRDQATGSWAIYTYQYTDIRNTYLSRVQHPIIDGILRWLLKNEGSIIRTYGDGEVVIPFVFDMKAPNMLSFLLCSASQDILWERNIIFKDVLFAGEQRSQYIWDDLQGLDKLNPLYSSQLKIGKYDEPLKMGQLAPDTKIREMWGQSMFIMNKQSGVGKDASAQYFLPWHFNEVAFKNTYDATSGFNREELTYNMSIPSIKDGVRHEYVDLIKSMSERDIRLSLDKWVSIPLFSITSNYSFNVYGLLFENVFVEHTPITDPSILNDHIKLFGIRYDGNSDGRVGVKYILEAGTTEYHLDEFSLYAVPKEEGWIFDCYDTQYYITAVDREDSALSLSITTVASTEVLDGCTVYSGAVGTRLISYRVDGDSDTARSIDRSAALSQCFYTFVAAQSAANINTEYVTNIGIYPSIASVELSNNGHVTMPFYNLNEATPARGIINNLVDTDAKYNATMIQRFFEPINDFETCAPVTSTSHPHDPLEQSMYFGFCGTLASDFTQDILERLSIIDQLGLDYTEDVFMHDSPIFK